MSSGGTISFVEDKVVITLLHSCSIQCGGMLKDYQTINYRLDPNLILLFIIAEIIRCSRFSEGSSNGFEKPSGEDTQGFFT